MYQPSKVEKENELIEKLAREIVNLGMEIPAIFMLESIRPVSRLTSAAGMIFVSPFIYFAGSLLGRETWGEQGFMILNMLQERENTERVIQRVEELVEEMEKKKREIRKNKSLQPKDKHGILSRIKGLIGR